MHLLVCLQCSSPRQEHGSERNGEHTWVCPCLGHFPSAQAFRVMCFAIASIIKFFLTLTNQDVY